jgi:glycosyltransferase involved in cell wall biosynthesis
MKILLTLDFPPEQGGIQRYLYDKAAHTYAAGDRVFVGTSRKDAESSPGLSCTVTRHANPLSRINKKWSIINLFFRLAALTRRPRPDVAVECGNVYAAIAAWALSFFRPLRYCVYAYGGELLRLRKKTPGAALLTGVLRRAREVRVITRYGEQLIRTARIPTPCVIDPPRIRVPGAASPPHSRPFAHDATIRLLTVGRLVEHKGHSVLLEACCALPASCAWHLVVAGSGPLERPLRAAAEKRGIADRVDFKKGLSDTELAEEYRKADIFVLPSRETPTGAEGFGIVLLEAMAEGLPVIASNTGGIAEVLDQGTCGVLVPQAGAAPLAAAILNLAGDPAVRTRLITNAYKRVREQYAWL